MLLGSSFSVNLSGGGWECTIQIIHCHLVFILLLLLHLTPMYIPPCAPTRADQPGVTLRESFVFTFCLLKMHQFLASLHFVRANFVRMLRRSCASRCSGSCLSAAGRSFVGKTAAFRSTFFGGFLPFQQSAATLRPFVAFS